MIENKSGIHPTGHHVLVLPDKVEEKTEGGIYLPEPAREEEQRAATKGILIDVGPTAWQEFADGEPWAQKGDYVSYAKYGGINMKGKDGKDYILLNDQDILAVLTIKKLVDNCNIKE